MDSEKSLRGYHIQTQLGKSVYTAKIVRQSLKLRAGAAITRLSPNFPVPNATSEHTPIYLIGSGASLLNFDFKNPEVVSSDLIAINDSMYLDFGAAYVHYELDTSPSWKEKNNQRLNELLQKDDLSVIFTLPRSLSLLGDIPQALKASPTRAHIFTSVSVHGEKILESYLPWYLETLATPKTPGLDPGFSLGRIILRLIKLGYKDIRLIGVDLFTPQHFWHESGEFGWIADYREVNESGPHNIASSDRTLTAQSFFSTLANLENQFDFRVRTDKNSGSSAIIPAWN